MEINEAKSLKVGEVIAYPEDRGERSGAGRITHISSEENKNFTGVSYIWITVQHNPNRRAVWPSNRLSRA
jgi:hypothetical protein